MAESKVRTEARKLALRLAGNPNLIEDFKAGVQEGMEEGINKEIDSLVAQQEQLTNFINTVKSLGGKDKKTKRQEAARKAAATRKANQQKAQGKAQGKAKPEKKSARRRKPGEHEIKLRTLLREEETLKKVVKRLYGVAVSADKAPENMWFKTTDLIRKVWQECFDYRLSSNTMAQEIARFIVPTLGAMEKAGTAARRGNSRHTRWILIN